jgi:hypothetical protein
MREAKPRTRRKATPSIPAILNTPIPAHTFPAHRRDDAVNDALAERMAALCDLYNIDPASSMRWEMLTWALVLRAFPKGFRIIDKPAARGAPKNSEVAYVHLAQEFDRQQGLKPNRKRQPQSKSRIKGTSINQRIAERILREHGGAISVGKQTITHWKSLLRAVNRGRAALRARIGQKQYLQAAVANALFGHYRGFVMPSLSMIGDLKKSELE